MGDGDERVMIYRHMDLGPDIAAMYLARGGKEVLCINVGLTPSEIAEAAYRIGREVDHVRPKTCLRAVPG